MSWLTITSQVQGVTGRAGRRGLTYRFRWQPAFRVPAAPPVSATPPGHPPGLRQRHECDIHVV